MSHNYLLERIKLKVEADDGEAKVGVSDQVVVSQIGLKTTGWLLGDPGG